MTSLFKALRAASVLGAIVLGWSLPVAMGQGADAGGIEFGDDSGEYPNDGECDDPRFTGGAAPVNVDWSQTGRDASDCAAAIESGARFWPSSESFVLADCSSTDFGEDSSDYANDGECDDPRFYGPDVSAILLSEDSGADFSDCMQACLSGPLFVRPRQ